MAVTHFNCFRDQDGCVGEIGSLSCGALDNGSLAIILRHKTIFPAKGYCCFVIAPCVSLHSKIISCEPLFAQVL